MSDTRSPGDKMLDDYVARGCPTDHGWRGWVGLGFVILVGLLAIGAIIGVWLLFLIAIDAYPVILSPVTPIAIY